MNIDGIIENIASNVPQPETGDFEGADGLIYCHKCGTPKQCRVEFLGRVKTVPCICKCAAERMRQEREEEERRKFERRVSELRKMGFADKDMRYCTFSADDGTNGKISTAAAAYVDNFQKFREDGRGLLLWGDVGTGKTFVAACIVNALIDKGFPCLMTNFARIANTLQGMYAGKQEYIDGLNRFALLVIDDLAAERKTEYMQELIFNIVDARYRSGLPMIITTNLHIDTLKNPDDKAMSRCYDRILERCFPLEVNGVSHRRRKIAAEYAQTKELLGL